MENKIIWTDPFYGVQHLTPKTPPELELIADLSAKRPSAQERHDATRAILRDPSLSDAEALRRLADLSVKCRAALGMRDLAHSPTFAGESE